MVMSSSAGSCSAWEKKGEIDGERKGQRDLHVSSIETRENKNREGDREVERQQRYTDKMCVGREKVKER